jgi:hypothetical protein
MHERAVVRAVLQVCGLEAIVQCIDVKGAAAQVTAYRRVVPALPFVVSGERARAVYFGVGKRIVRAAAYVKVAIRDCALDH